MRAMAVAPLLAVAGFCGFGFLATFEPLDPATQVTWRVIYGLVGLSSLASIILLDEFGIRAPSIENEKARFYFTEAGWRRAGSKVAVEARRCGHVLRVIRRKNPEPSQVVYRDELQVAILPIRRTKRTERQLPTASVASALNVRVNRIPIPIARRLVLVPSMTVCERPSNHVP